MNRVLTVGKDKEFATIDKTVEACKGLMRQRRLKSLLESTMRNWPSLSLEGDGDGRTVIVPSPLLMARIRGTADSAMVTILTNGFRTSNIEFRNDFDYYAHSEEVKEDHGKIKGLPTVALYVFVSLLVRAFLIVPSMTARIPSLSTEKRIFFPIAPLREMLILYLELDRLCLRAALSIPRILDILPAMGMQVLAPSIPKENWFFCSTPVLQIPT